MKKRFQNARVEAVKAGADVTKVKVLQKRLGIEKVTNEEKERKRRKLDFVFGESSGSQRKEVSSGSQRREVSSGGDAGEKSGEESKKSKTSFNNNPSKSGSTDGSKVGRKGGSQAESKKRSNVGNRKDWIGS